MHFDLPAKLALVFLMWVCAFAVDWKINAILIFILIVMRYNHSAFSPISLNATNAFKRFIGYSAIVTVLLVILNALFIRGGQQLWTFGGFTFYSEGMLFGVKTATRLLILSYAILLLFISTPIPDFVRFLQQRGFPAQLVLILLLTLHFLEQLPDRINQIFIAQEARGAPVRAGLFSRIKAFFPILTPLVFSSISESIDRGMALELRGFLTGAEMVQRSSEPKKNSRLAVVLMLAACILILITLTLWLFQ